MCDSESLIVTLHVNTTSIQPVNKILSVHTRTFDICLPGVHCFEAHNFSLAFNNSEGMSEFSKPFTIGGPTGSELSSNSVYNCRGLSCMVHTCKLHRYSSVEQCLRCSQRSTLILPHIINISVLQALLNPCACSVTFIDLYLQG